MLTEVPGNYFTMRCSGSERYTPPVITQETTPPTQAKSSTTANDIKTIQLTQREALTATTPIISRSTTEQSKIVAFSTQTTQMMNDSPGQNGFIYLPVLLAVSSANIVLIILVVVLLTCYVMKRRSSEQNDRNQAVNPNVGHGTNTGSPTATAPVYANVPNQIQASVSEYESVNLMLLRPPNPEESVYTSLASNQDRNTYLEPIIAHRNSNGSELNDPYESIE